MEEKRKYLEDCKTDYSKSVAKAQKLYPEVYVRIQELEYLVSDFLDYVTNVKQGLKCDDISFLEDLIKRGVSVPGAYEKLAILYLKNKDVRRAYVVCEKWFDSVYWKIPNMATGSLKLLDRLEKLEVKLEGEKR